MKNENLLFNIIISLSIILTLLLVLNLILVRSILTPISMISIPILLISIYVLGYILIFFGEQRRIILGSKFILSAPLLIISVIIGVYLVMAIFSPFKSLRLIEYLGFLIMALSLLLIRVIRNLDKKTTVTMKALLFIITVIVLGVYLSSFYSLFFFM